MAQSDIQVTGKAEDRKDGFFHKRFIVLQLIPAAQVSNTYLVFSLNAEDSMFLKLLALKGMQKVTMKIKIYKQK